MIELNLLPDVKMEYIKAQNLRRMMFTVSAIVTVVSVVLLGFLVSINQLQKKHLSDLSGDIKKESAQLKNKPQISKILTVQNQLGSLTNLHAAKPAAYNVFGYLNQVTPSNISLNTFHADFAESSISLAGSADSLSEVNKYIDTLKFTTYKVDGSGDLPAFGNVVLGTFNLNSSATPGNKPATFTILLNYDPKIFDITQKIQLSIPTKTTTRSMTDNPTDLFQAAPPPSTSSNSVTTGGN